MGLHPGHEDLVQYIENLALKHFKYQEGLVFSLFVVLAKYLFVVS